MGGGSWTTNDFKTYSTSVGRNTATVDGITQLSGSYKAQDLFKSRSIQAPLNPFNVVRECRDSEEHPNTIPVILALDVTGSMGDSAVEVAKKLNEIMTQLYEKVTDVEFLVMGIGDLAYDSAPVQASQYESDIRIAEQLDKIYFEGGGGGNGFESYSAAWYFGLRHTDLDCWKRGEKGIIITMGDEPLNPYLPASRLKRVFGDSVERDIETAELYQAACKKFDLYHLAVDDTHSSYRFYSTDIKKSFGKYFDEDHLLVVNLDNIAGAVVDIITKASNFDNIFGTVTDAEATGTNSGISW